MTPLEKVTAACYNNTLQLQSKHDIALAYLQLHIDEPGLHPDDWLTLHGGYCGVHVLVVYAFNTQITEIPDFARYPMHMRFNWVLGALASFHASDDEPLMLNHVKAVQAFFQQLGADDLQKAVDSVLALIAFHDDCPEDIADALNELHNLLIWLNKL